MAGHNKWSKIKHKKAVTDARKSKEFSKVIRLISAESKKANGDVNSPGLRVAIEKAKSINMPSSNIDRAVQKGTKSDIVENEVVYETYGPGGVAIVITALTDNKNRTGPEIKHILTKSGLQLANPGSASWMFKKNESGYVPETKVQLSDSDKEKTDSIMEAISEHDDVQEVFVNYE